MATTVKVTGLRELDMRLKALADEFGASNARGPIRTALRKAGAAVQKEAKRLVRVDRSSPDDLVHVRDNVVVYSAKNQPPGRAAVNVTVRSRSRTYANTAKNRREGRAGLGDRKKGLLFYASYLEFGTSEMPAYPFMRPAIEATKNDLPEIFRAELSIAIERTLAKLRSA